MEAGNNWFLNVQEIEKLSNGAFKFFLIQKDTVDLILKEIKDL